jgi:hypothetical protein
VLLLLGGAAKLLARYTHNRRPQISTLSAAGMESSAEKRVA